MELADYDKAINSFNAAINIDNNFYQSQHNLSFVLLLTNSFKLGWKKYEYRLKKIVIFLTSLFQIIFIGMAQA